MQVTGVIHIHSTYSYDGKVSLRDLKELFKGKGWQFACLTEHTDELSVEAAAAFVAECRALSDESFLFIPGFEVPYKNAHVLHLGATEFLGQFADAQQLAQWRKVTPLVVLAHPVRNQFAVDETLASVLDGVEVWNQQYEGKLAPRFRSLRLYQELTNGHPSLIATGGLDLHRVEHVGTPVIQLEVEALTEASVLLGLKTGAFVIDGAGLNLSAQGAWLKGSQPAARLKSRLSILIIASGKLVNATLARFGIRLPKSLAQLIRSRV